MIAWPPPHAGSLYAGYAHLRVTPDELCIIRASLDTYYMAQMTDATDTPASRARLLKTGEMLKQLPKEP